MLACHKDGRGRRMRGQHLTRRTQSQLLAVAVARQVQENKVMGQTPRAGPENGSQRSGRLTIRQVAMRAEHTRYRGR